MISLLIDESGFFDFISILEVKISKAQKDKKFTIQSQLKYYINNLKEQIGDEKFEEVYNSVSYLKLKDCNKDIFELIDNAENYSVQFRFANKLNDKRSEFKNEIQQTYFGRPSSEIKLR